MFKHAIVKNVVVYYSDERNATGKKITFSYVLSASRFTAATRIEMFYWHSELECIGSYCKLCSFNSRMFRLLKNKQKRDKALPSFRRNYKNEK